MNPVSGNKLMYRDVVWWPRTANRKIRLLKEKLFYSLLFFLLICIFVFFLFTNLFIYLIFDEIK